MIFYILLISFLWRIFLFYLVYELIMLKKKLSKEVRKITTKNKNLSVMKILHVFCAEFLGSFVSLICLLIPYFAELLFLRFVKFVFVFLFLKMLAAKSIIKTLLNNNVACVLF